MASSHSLKSLPTAREVQSGDAKTDKFNNQQMDLGLVTDAAKWLARMLNLTIFGFDVVVSTSYSVLYTCYKQAS